MRVHHLNCGTCCPAGGRLFDGTSDGPLGHLVCHCLLIESDAGLILIDTGFGTRDIDHPHRRLSEFFLKLNNIQLRPEETAIAQVRALGFSPADVRHIVVSDWRLYPFGGGEPWMGFDAVRDLDGLPPEILLVPLAGHTWGHSGVAVREEWQLAASRRRRLFLPWRDRIGDVSLPARVTRISAIDGGRSQGASEQPGTAPSAFARSDRRAHLLRA